MHMNPIANKSTFTQRSDKSIHVFNLHWWRVRYSSFRYAATGIASFFRTGFHARVHLASALMVGGLSIYLGVSRSESLFLLWSVGLVWITEILNTAIEKIMDFISVQRHPQIKLIKDLAAGAVLVAAVCALVTGCIIFIPKLLHQ